MYEELKYRLLKSLEAELDYVAKFEKDKSTKFDKMLQIKNIMRLIEQYEEIEPTIKKAMNELAQKKRFKEER
jgi:deoxyhypusine synthase